jgi:hypothetical protein
MSRRGRAGVVVLCFLVGAAGVGLGRAGALESVLDSIAAQSGVLISTERLAGERVSARFDSLPLDEGLRRILRETGRAPGGQEP